MLARLLALVAVAVAAASCVSTDEARPVGDAFDVDQPTGLFVVDGREVPDELTATLVPTGTRLGVRVIALPDAPGGSFELGVVGCSWFGGPVSSLSPLTSTATTLAGLDGCAEEDAFARRVLGRMEGSQLTLDEVTGELVVFSDGGEWRLRPPSDE